MPVPSPTTATRLGFGCRHIGTWPSNDRCRRSVGAADATTLPSTQSSGTTVPVADDDGRDAAFGEVRRRGRGGVRPAGVERGPHRVAPRGVREREGRRTEHEERRDAEPGAARGPAPSRPPRRRGRARRRPGASPPSRARGSRSAPASSAAAALPTVFAASTRPVARPARAGSGSAACSSHGRAAAPIAVVGTSTTAAASARMRSSVPPPAVPSAIAAASAAPAPRATGSTAHASPATGSAARAHTTVGVRPAGWARCGPSRAAPSATPSRYTPRTVPKA